MSLIVEDGTGVVGATSYVDEAAIIAYALARGVVIDDPAATLAGIKAMDYLEVQNYHGTPTLPDVQELSWPRTPLKNLSLYQYGDSWYCFGGPTPIGPNVIPKNLKMAQCELALQSFNGIDLLPSRGTDQFTKVEKIGGTQGAIEVEYFAPPGDVPLLTRAEKLLRPLLNVGFNDIKVVRA